MWIKGDLRSKHLGDVDVTDFQRRVLELTEVDWKVHNQSNAMTQLNKDVDSIVFRNGGDEPGSNYTDHYGAWSLLGDELRPILEVLPPIHRIRLARLRVGGIIIPHIDAAEFYRHRHRVHIPIITNDDVRFLVDFERIHMPEGSIVEINNRMIHSVENRGTRDRVNLVLDYYDE